VQHGPEHFAPTVKPVPNRTRLIRSSQFGQGQQHPQDIPLVADLAPVPLVAQRAEALIKAGDIQHGHLWMFKVQTERTRRRLHESLLWRVCDVLQQLH